MNNSHFISTDFEYINFDFENIERYDLTPTENVSKEGFSFEEQYEVPVMNCVRYFPRFVEFLETDRRGLASATTLIYDNEVGQWGVAMTCGGMDLSPHLLSTFIKLNNGIPLDIAVAVDSGYSGYISENEHKQNCFIVAESLDYFGDTMKCRSRNLKGSI